MNDTTLIELAPTLPREALALADAPSLIDGVLDSRDTALMRAGLTALGARIEDVSATRVRVVPADAVTGGGTVDCGLAGTVLGFGLAGSLLGSLPVAIFYSFFVDYYVSSLTGAVKE